ncbi:hypothetical protein [Flavobacterium yafengii]|uniref:DUF4303 domain-containing protein n=1 Tax=Flavobacterium yafengii TaxID=3041253 RepID=A0AAW6TMY4_9FLAO|nr:hypothetical protein [Flavobacterium yafengii]MDI5948542.1 hypothetical protein [Flavobacterium yafengii]
MKKKIPLQILKTLVPFLKKESSMFEIIPQNQFLIKIVDKDKNSDFHFIIEDFKNESAFSVLVNRKPESDLATKIHRKWVNADLLEKEFQSWLNILEDYDNIKSIFDDNILEAFSNEYYSEFEIIDEDAEINPLKIKQILLLDEHLEKIQNNIEKYKTDINEVEIDDIICEVIELRENLTKKSKKWVIKKLSVVWAKISKQGPVLIKEFLSEGSKYLIKESVKFIFEKGIDLLH